MTKRKRKYLIGLLTTLAVISGGLLFVKYGRDLPLIKQTNVLRVITEKDTADNFDYEIVKHYADSIGVSIKVVHAHDFAYGLQLLKEGGGDVFIRLIPTTTRLKEQMNFTYPIIKSRLMLVQNKEHVISSFNDLEDDTIYVERHSPYILRLENFKKETGVNVHVYELGASTDELLKMVDDGAIRYTVCSEFQLHLTRQDLPNVDVQKMIGVRHFLAWGVAKNAPKLNGDLDDWLKVFVETQEFRDLIRKYYH